MKRSGFADLPLHSGHVPQWLAERMTKLGAAIAETVIRDYGVSAFLSRLSDPFWFQALGAVMGMDWHSSGVTTSIMGALKRGLASRADELGLYVCGGRGKHSRNTPQELLNVAERRGLDGDMLVRQLVRGNEIGRRIDTNYQLRARLERPLISIITVGESFALARKFKWGKGKLDQLKELLRELVVVDIHASVLEKYAEISDYLENIDQPMGQNDMWIAATTAASNS